MKALVPIVLLALAIVGCGEQEKPKVAKNTTPPVLTAPINYAALQGLFDKQCLDCHSAAKPKAKLSLANYEDMMKGGEDGAVVVPGDPDKGLLIPYLKGTKTPRMPATKPPLADSDVQAIADWIKAGAKKS